jgi:hypothetical protein
VVNSTWATNPNTPIGTRRMKNLLVRYKTGGESKMRGYMHDTMT